QRVIVTTDNIDLTAAATPKIAEEDLVTVTPEIATRQRLAAGASPEMTGFGRCPPTREAVAPPARKIGDGSGKGRIHVVGAGATRFRNLCAGRSNTAGTGRKSHASSGRALPWRSRWQQRCSD